MFATTSMNNWELQTVLTPKLTLLYAYDVVVWVHIKFFLCACKKVTCSFLADSFLLSFPHHGMYIFSQQFSSNSGLSLLVVFMDLLKTILLKANEVELCSTHEKESAQTKPDLFVDMETLTAVETSNDKVLTSAFQQFCAIIMLVG